MKLRLGKKTSAWDVPHRAAFQVDWEPSVNGVCGESALGLPIDRFRDAGIGMLSLQILDGRSVPCFDNPAKRSIVHNVIDFA